MDLDELEMRLDELEERTRQLEERKSDDSPGYYKGLDLTYAMGMSIAIVLSWARNGGILWCMLHGLLSWGYVIYYALTR
jgi:hypothetical protein